MWVGLGPNGLCFHTRDAVLLQSDAVYGEPRAPTAGPGAEVDMTCVVVVLLSKQKPSSLKTGNPIK